MATTDVEPLQGAESKEAFAFVSQLARELSQASVELPSFPEVAIRVQKALAEDSCNAESVVRILGVEPLLAARVLTMANSAALNPRGAPVADLRTAVARVGFDTLRSAAISFAIQQLQRAKAYAGIERALNAHWQHSVVVASLALVLARRTTKVNIDTAMLTGLVHGVGKLYILTRAASYPALFKDQAQFQRIVRAWHSNIAKALLEAWFMPQEIVTAVQTYEDSDREQRGAAAVLADILEISDLLSLHDSQQQASERLQNSKAALRLMIDPGAAREVVAQSGEELNALRGMLAGKTR